MFSLTRRDAQNWSAEVTRFASHHPVKFVAVASLLATGALPILAFLLYALGTVSFTLIAAVVLDLVLLALGACGLALALCFVGCATGSIVGCFSLLYFAYTATVGGLREAKARLAPSTVVPSSSSPPAEAQTDESVDKNKLDRFTGLTASLTNFIVGFLILTSFTGEPSDTETVGVKGEEEVHSDLCRTSLLILALTFSVVGMSYFVLFTTYLVVHFT